MFNSEILEVAIGLIFTFLIAALLASSVREMCEAVLKTRAIQLERGIRQLLDDPTGRVVTRSLFQNPLLYGLFAGGYDPDTQLKRFWLWPAGHKEQRGEGAAMIATPPQRLTLFSNLPAYIPSRNFALALMQVVGVDGGGVLTFESLEANALALRPGRLREAMLAAISEGGRDLDRVRVSLESWFDSNMDRVAGWYKRESQYVLFALGLIIAVGLNINSLSIVSELAHNNALRLSTISQAQNAIDDVEAHGKACPTRPRMGDGTGNSQNAAAGNSVATDGDPACQPVLKPDELRQMVGGLSQLIGRDRFDSDVRDGLAKEIDAAQAAVRDSKARADLTAAQSRLAELKDPATARKRWRRHALGSIPGWILTAIAISLGAPFWFDLLNKFMMMRSTVKPSTSAVDELYPPGAPSPTPGPGGGGGGGPIGVGGAGTGAVGGAGGGPSLVSQRLAVDLAGLDAGSLGVSLDGKAIEVPPSGFVELRLAVGELHRLAAAATRSGQAVAWSQTVIPHINSEAEPLEAALA